MPSGIVPTSETHRSRHASPERRELCNRSLYGRPSLRECPRQSAAIAAVASSALPGQRRRPRDASSCLVRDSREREALVAVLSGWRDLGTRSSIDDRADARLGMPCHAPMVDPRKRSDSNIR